MEDIESLEFQEQQLTKICAILKAKRFALLFDSESTEEERSKRFRFLDAKIETLETKINKVKSRISALVWAGHLRND